MNVYFLVEGKTEKKVYPKWISHLVPKLSRISHPTEAIANHYFLISGNGYPSILDNHLVDSVADINSIGNYDFLVLVIDTDDQSAADKVGEVECFVKEHKLDLKQCKLIIIPQVVCMETWFLGNQKIYARSPDAECSPYTSHYNVAKDDPELMQKFTDYNGTNADFHYNYLKILLRSKNIRYSKSIPHGVDDVHYIEALKNRITVTPTSLKSMGRLFEFFYELQSER